MPPFREPLLGRRDLLTLAAASLCVARSALADATPLALPLPGLYDDRIDPAPYLVSEKFDGVRGVWDGRSLRFRSGREVPAPAWFTAQLPREALDGELWLGRGRFDALSGIVRREAPEDAGWREVRYMVFDVPGAPGHFGERTQRLASLVRDTAWPQLVAVEQAPAVDRAQLQRRLAEVLARGGEGVVLTRANAPYRSGRSDAVLKLKPELDTEAIVIGHRPGQGKYAGQLGALEVQTPAGRRFFIGTGFSDALRQRPPALGSVITYRYRGLTASGLPRFASYWRQHDAL